MLYNNIIIKPIWFVIWLMYEKIMETITLYYYNIFYLIK